MDLYILQNIFSNENTSLFAYLSKRYHVKPTILVETELNDIYKFDHWIQLGTHGYSFVTCYSEDVITFDFYVTRFQTKLWYALLATYICLTLALSFWLFWNMFKGAFCPWMYVLGALLEDGVPLPGKIEKSSFFRVIFGCWIIVCVLFSNFYNGLMIKDLNAPLHAMSVITFRDLVCDWQDVKYSFKEYKEMTKNLSLVPFSLANFYLIWYDNYVFKSYRMPGTRILNVTENPFSSTSSKCFAMLSFPHEKYSCPKFFLFLRNLFMKFYRVGWLPHLKTQELELNLFHPKQRHLPRNMMEQKKLNYSQQIQGIEKEVVDCGKTAFAATPEELEAEVAYYARQYPWIKFYKSRDTVNAKPMGVGINSPGGSKIPRNAVSLIESGIHSSLRKEKYERRNFRRKRVGVIKPRKEKMTMNGCISTLFILCGIILAFAIVVLNSECCYYFKERILLYLLKIVRHSYRKCKNYKRSVKKQTIVL